MSNCMRVRSSFQNVKSWLDEIDKYAGEKCVQGELSSEGQCGVLSQRSLFCSCSLGTRAILLVAAWLRLHRERSAPVCSIVEPVVFDSASRLKIRHPAGICRREGHEIFRGQRQRKLQRCGRIHSPRNRNQEQMRPTDLHIVHSERHGV